MSESSSSEDENSARLKEAVWSFGPQDIKINGNDGENKSRRVDVSKHEHDGNELGTTPEFQSHVAKKLGAILDGCISEVFSKTVVSEPGQSKNRDEEGFRLFSTSTSGKWMEQSPPAPKRRPIPSSSDSDSEMEMRLREAAVSVSDILGPLAQTLTEKTEGKSTTNVESGKEDTVAKKTKKKKKRKTFTEGSEEKSIDVSEKQSNGKGTEAQTTVVENLTKKKKKKKKRKKLDSSKGDDE
ncbi:protein CUSTOS [Siphateles boraxobius]|uniref:protein CUSTOS n=1 Tax=Siphateles boraxobius TaxID=180520 RepID=UPI004063BFA7